MLKFKEWHNYNSVENKVMDYIGDIYIKVFRKLPNGTGFRTDKGNMMFSTLMRLEDAAKMFGELPLSRSTFIWKMIIERYVLYLVGKRQK